MTTESHNILSHLPRYDDKVFTMLANTSYLTVLPVFVVQQNSPSAFPQRKSDEIRRCRTSVNFKQYNNKLPFAAERKSSETRKNERKRLKAVQKVKKNTSKTRSPSKIKYVLNVRNKHGGGIKYRSVSLQDWTWLPVRRGRNGHQSGEIDGVGLAGWMTNSEEARALSALRPTRTMGANHGGFGVRGR